MELDDNGWFVTPEAAVSGTTVEMTCRTRFAAGALDGVRVGFTYASIVGGVIGPFAESADCRVEGSSFVSTLNGLLPETVYAVYAFADLPTGRVQSPAGSFRTGKGFVNPDLAKYAGWAELPAVQNTFHRYHAGPCIRHFYTDSPFARYGSDDTDAQCAQAQCDVVLQIFDT